MEVELYFFALDEAVDDGKSQIGVDGTCAVARKEREMHHFASVGSLDDEGRLHAFLAFDEVVVHS